MNPMIVGRPEDVGALVRDRRRALGLTQSEIAKSLGVSQRYISRLESGRSTLQLGLVLRVLRQLRVSLEVNLPDDNSDNKHSAQERRPKKPRKKSKISIDRLVDG